MKMKILIRTFIVSIILFITVSTYAQPGGGGNPGAGGGGPPVPISGIEILLAAGGILGIWRTIKSGRKSE